MSFLERTHVEPSDAELIARVRGGDKGAYGELFERHREAATRLARSLTRGSDADDLVSEAFTKVFRVLLGGGGPDLAFRAYLLTSIRRLNIDKARAVTRTTPTDDIETLDSGVPFIDPAVTDFESGAAARAFASLPERWQLVLWHLEVEGQKPAEIAPLLGMSPNSVSVLAYRAREGLRQAFLQMHAADVVDEECEWTRSKLGAYVRKATSRRDAEKVESHLRGCRPCTAVYLELTEVNSSLSALLGPLVLGAAAVAYLGGGAAATGSATVLGGAFSRVAEFVTANTQAAIVTGTVATVAAAGAVGVAVTRDDPGSTVAANTPASSQAPAPATSSAPEPESARTSEAPEPVLDESAEPAPEPVAEPAGEPEPDGPAADAPRSPDSNPAPKPKPEPAPGPKPGPAPSPTPSPTPTPVDAAVAVSVNRLAVLQGFTVQVSGVPDGVTTTLDIDLSANGLTVAIVRVPRGCTPHGQRLSCTGVGNQSFGFLTVSAGNVTATARIGAIPGDTNAANNVATATS